VVDQKLQFTIFLALA